MLQEDFPAAWAIADDVLRTRDPQTRDHPGYPYHERWVWDGRPLTGRVVVRCYHGLGDTLQFIRFLPALRDRAAHVTLEVQSELQTLASYFGGADRVIPFDQAAPVAARDDIEIMELQHALRMLPSGRPYLSVPPIPVLGATTGVCWQAGSWDVERSVPLSQLRRVLPAGVVSLQRGAAGLPDPLGGTMDVLATASLIASLERVITVDTMIAHLAGALGRRVHLLLKSEADWRWGKGSRTAWYPNTIIHRQCRAGDWGAALDSLEASLREEG